MFSRTFLYFDTLEFLDPYPYLSYAFKYLNISIFLFTYLCS